MVSLCIFTIIPCGRRRRCRHRDKTRGQDSGFQEPSAEALGKEIESWRPCAKMLLELGSRASGFCWWGLTATPPGCCCCTEGGASAAVGAAKASRDTTRLLRQSHAYSFKVHCAPEGLNV